MKPRIRIDDVLQTRLLTHWQVVALKQMPMFEWFKLATKIDKPYILAVVAEGIDSQPEWVEYIKERGWEVQCHGWEHRDYAHTSHKEMIEQLKRAKEKIEKTFGVAVSKFYPPKMKYNDRSMAAAREAGMEETRERCPLHKYLNGEIKNPSEVYFHYWSPNLWLASAEVF